MRIKVLSKRFKEDERGAILIIAALMLTMLMGFMALGIDVGVLYFQQKTLQTRADLAAVSAASNLKADPRTRAIETIEGNDLEEGSLTAIEYGRFIRDPELPPEDRLAARDLSDTDVNAARVTLTTQAPLYFAQVFLDENTTRLQAKATAARYDTASFSLGSRLVRIEAGLLNAVLSEAVGTTVKLDVLDYEALADADINLLDFSDALATRLGITAGNYEDLLIADANIADVAGALLDANPAGDLTGALTALINSGTKELLNVSDLILIQGEDITALAPDLLPEITVSARDLLNASADIINADRHVATRLDLGIPGLTSIDLDLLVGERAVDSGWITVGERGTTLHTAQVRLKLDLAFGPSVLNGVNGGLDITSINLPIYIEAGSATVTLSSLDCSATTPGDVIATFDTGTDPLTGGTGTHAAEIFLGELNEPLEFGNTTKPLNQADWKAADFLGTYIRPLGLPLLDAVITIKAHAPLAVSEQAQVSFTLGDLTNGGTSLERTFGSGRVLESVAAALVSNADLDIELRAAGISLGLVNSLLNSVLSTVEGILGDILASLLPPIDAILDALLEILGIGIGEADLTLHGVACDRLLLVR